MNRPQERVVYGYSVSEHTYMSTAGPPTYPPPPPPPPPSRLSPFRILVRAFIGACVLIGALSLLIWLIYRPRTIRVAVANATLAGFDLNTTTTSFAPVLSYNLTAVVEITNPNRRLSVYYDQLQAVALYQDERFGRAALPVSFQGTRRADAAPAALVGSSSVDVNADEFREDSRAGVFPLELWVDGVVRYKFGELTTTRESTLTVKCHLALKLMVPSGWIDCTVIDFSILIVRKFISKNEQNEVSVKKMRMG